jgi:hypothetical protein
MEVLVVVIVITVQLLSSILFLEVCSLSVYEATSEISFSKNNTTVGFILFHAPFLVS